MGQMGLLRKFAFAALVALGSVLPAAAAERAIVVLDGSGSMWAQIEGRARITIARETLDSVLQSLPGDLELGFMTYGHREKGNCEDIELLVPPAAGAAGAISSAAAEINPKGMTPLSDAVRIAAEELRYTEERATVILITDGLETCEVDPCQLGSELEATGIEFTAHVVGFGLSDEEGQQVACLAENTGGRYLAANDAEALTSALTQTVAEVMEPEPEPEPEPAAPEFNLLPQVVMSEAGVPLPENAAHTWKVYLTNADGSRGKEITYGYGDPFEQNLEPGNYIVSVKYGEALSEQAVAIAEGVVAEPYFVLNAATVIVRAYAAEGEPVKDGAALTIDYPGGDSYGYGETTFIVPAGELTIAAKAGQGEVSETFTIAAGERVEKDLIAGVGRVVVNAFYVEGMKVEDDGLGVHIFQATQAIDGSREEMGYGFGPDTDYDLPPGDYVAVTRKDSAEVETPFTVSVGQLTEVSGILDAGVVAIAAPGVYGLRILSGKADLQGNRAEFGYSFEEEMQRTLTAGDYVVRARYDNGTEKDVPFTVTAGERIEVTVEPDVAKAKS